MQVWAGASVDLDVDADIDGHKLEAVSVDVVKVARVDVCKGCVCMRTCTCVCMLRVCAVVLA